MANKLSDYSSLCRRIIDSTIEICYINLNTQHLNNYISSSLFDILMSFILEPRLRSESYKNDGLILRVRNNMQSCSDYQGAIGYAIAKSYIRSAKKGYGLQEDTSHFEKRVTQRQITQAEKNNLINKGDLIDIKKGYGNELKVVLRLSTPGGCIKGVYVTNGEYLRGITCWRNFD